MLLNKNIKFYIYLPLDVLKGLPSINLKFLGFISSELNPLNAFVLGIVVETEVCGEMEVVENGTIGDSILFFCSLKTFSSFEKGIEFTLSFVAE